MPSLRVTADINGTRETIFDLIADLTHYDRWLPGSKVFGGMTQVSPVSPVNPKILPWVWHALVKAFDLMLRYLYDGRNEQNESLDESIRTKGISGRRNERIYLGRESGKNLVE